MSLPKPTADQSVTSPAQWFVGRADGDGLPLIARPDVACILTACLRTFSCLSCLCSSLDCVPAGA